MLTLAPVLALVLLLLLLLLLLLFLLFLLLLLAVLLAALLFFFFMVLLVMGVVLLLLLMAAVAVLVLRWVGSRARRGSLVSPRVRALFLPCLRPANDPVSTAARAAFWPPWNRPPRKPLGWRVGWRGFAAPAAAGAAGAAGAAAASPSPAAASPSAAAAAAGAAASISRGGGDHGGDVLWRGSTLVARSSDFR